MTAIVFPQSEYQALRAALLSQAPNEAAALLLAGPAISTEKTRLLVREASIVGSADCLTQTPNRVVISANMLAQSLKRARAEGLSLILAHSHPQDTSPIFSAVDDDGEREFLPTVFSRAPGRPHGTLVIGAVGFDARLSSASEKTARVRYVQEVGRDVVKYPRREIAMPLGVGAGAFGSTFDRNVLAFGQAGQEILRSLNIGIVGLGGTGSIVAEQLAHLGVGTLTLLDPDVVEASNTNRVVGSGGQIGKSKVASAAQLVSGIRSDITVRPLRGAVHIRPEALPLLDADLIFCCTDTHGSRAVLNQIAYQYLIPVIDVGIRIDARDHVVERITGRVQMLSPGLPCLVCQDFLDPEEVRRDLLSDEERHRDPYIVGAAEAQPAVISLNGTVASLAVTMMLSSVTGVPMGTRHQVYLGDRGTVRAVSGSPQPDCIVCSSAGALARGDSWQLPWRLL